jgi:toxin ParE1/3/4
MDSRSISYSPLALQHLEEIAYYTENTWGLKQRQKYMQELFDRIESLIQYPHRAKKRDDVAEDKYSIKSGRHVIFVHFLPDLIEVVGVLHERMDPKRHL